LKNVSKCSANSNIYEHAKSLECGLLTTSARSGVAAQNTSYGPRALQNNTTGTNKQRVRLDALFSNSTGSGDSATGANGLQNNTIKPAPKKQAGATPSMNAPEVFKLLKRMS